MSGAPTHVMRWSTLSLVPAATDSPAPSGVAQVEFGAQSCPGRGRSANEDHYLILRLERRQDTLLTNLPSADIPDPFGESGYGMILADGLGRHAGVASRLGVTTLAHLMVAFGKWNLRVDERIAEEIADRAERFYRSIDLTMLRAGANEPLGLQTTLTAVYTSGKELFFAHVGHSRAYLFRDGALMQLTRDHTLAADRQSQSSAPEDEDSGTPDLHHSVTQTMGRPRPGGPRIDVERFGLLDHDAVLLCTNGLTDVLSEASIAAVLRRPHTPDEKCRTLVEMVGDVGGKDDTTALLAQYRLDG